MGRGQTININRSLEDDPNPHGWMTLRSSRLQWRKILDMESTPDENAVKIVEMTAKDLDYHVNLVDKAWHSLRTDSNSERSSSVGKMSSNGTACY